MAFRTIAGQQDALFMPKKKQTGPARASAPRTPAKAVGEGALMTTRIDPPHQIGAPEPDLPAAVATPLATTDGTLAESVASTVRPATVRREAAQQEALHSSALVVPLALTFEQVQSQAAQLAAHLCKQQSTLDHREAEVNARAAAVESQVRTARLWLVEKLEELAERTAELSAAASARAQPAPSDHAPGSSERDGHAPPADARTTQDGSPDSEPAAMFGTLRFWKQRHWQEEFERWRSAREPAAEGSAAIAGAMQGPIMAGHDRTLDGSSTQAGAAGENERRLAAAERQLATRAAELEGRRRELAAEREALETDREALESEREVFVAERQADLHRLADQRRVMSEKLMRQRARLRRRRDDFDAREMALRQLRADLIRMQHQTLEMRLGAEEQWARLRGKGADGGPARAEPRAFAIDDQREGAA
jgi:hypothetical protein